ncbi:MAG: NADH ubiquinone oxidoreductase [Candidatus Thioglobus sp.]|nr:MAG: NADH ubiquinone oxidoreductase [Candidatus Thioglobus sp.]
MFTSHRPCANYSLMVLIQFTKLISAATLACFSLMTNADKEGPNLWSATSANDWQFVSDQVMGGVSSGEVSVSLEDVTPLVQMTGDVSTANNGGFIQIRRDVSNLTAQKISGVYLTVKGNGEKYFVHIRTKWTVLPWQYYQAEFATSNQWRETRLPIGEFNGSSWLLPKNISGGDIRSIGIVAFGRDHVADISVREVGFF